MQAFAARIRTGRILVNAPTAVGALGGIYTAMPPTFSLGCGTWGGSTTTDNINYRNLLNIKAVSRRQAPPQWFRVPSDTYFNAGALDSLRTLDAGIAVIVTDAPTQARGAADEVRRHLGCDAVHVIGDVEPEPGEACVRAGAELLDRLRPDLLVAVGGGSVIDAAKAMRLFHEHPEVTLRELTLPFLDARKRVARYPQGEHSVRLVAVPTTSGTGSEVSPAAVVTAGDRKVTLVDYSLVPDMAVVDPTLTLTMPPELTADTGIDALTHALEAYVSIFASPYTDAFCLQADPPDPRRAAAGRRRRRRPPRPHRHGQRRHDRRARVLERLPRRQPRPRPRRRRRFGIAHGRVNGVFLPHVLRYNAAVPAKFMPAPGYSAYVAPEKYARIAWVLGLGGRGEEARASACSRASTSCCAEVGIPRSFGSDGDRPRGDWDASVPDLCRAAFADPSGRTNPRMPMVGAHGAPRAGLLWPLACVRDGGDGDTSGRGSARRRCVRRLAGAAPPAPPGSSRSYGSIVRANVFTVFNAILTAFAAVTLAVRGPARRPLPRGRGRQRGDRDRAGGRAKRALDRLSALVAPTATVVRDGGAGGRASTKSSRRPRAARAGRPGGRRRAARRRQGLASTRRYSAGSRRRSRREAGEAVRSGSFVVEGRGSCEVEAVGADSYAERIAGEARAFRHPRSPLEHAFNRLLLGLVAAMVPLGAVLGVSCACVTSRSTRPSPRRSRQW